MTLVNPKVAYLLLAPDSPPQSQNPWPPIQSTGLIHCFYLALSQVPECYSTPGKPTHPTCVRCVPEGPVFPCQLLYIVPLIFILVYMLGDTEWHVWLQKCCTHSQAFLSLPKHNLCPRQAFLPLRGPNDSLCDQTVDRLPWVFFSTMTCPWPCSLHVQFSYSKESYQINLLPSSRFGYGSSLPQLLLKYNCHHNGIEKFWGL